MVDFLRFVVEHKKNCVEIKPDFDLIESQDLMIRGSDFYAIWLEDKKTWSTKEQDAIRLIDNELKNYAEEYQKTHVDDDIRIMRMRSSRSGSIDLWHKYCQKQCRDNFHMLDESLIFSNTEVTRQDYASKKLDYPLAEGTYNAWDTIVGTLYSPEERHKIEWAIGAIVNGASKSMQKFIVFYGAAGTGKSTIINIMEQLFKGYYASFDAKVLGAANASFALEAFRENPLVAIQHDGDLSHIEDNTRLNSLVSHEIMSVNTKHKSVYDARFKSFLVMGTNRPVKITDAKSGLLRRLIDISPSGNKIPSSEYKKLVKQVKFELGAIAKHCLDVYEADPGYYDDYIPIKMIGASNDFYNFMLDSYSIFKNNDGTTMTAAWKLYKTYCEEARVNYPFSQRVFKEELKNYFKDFKDRFEMADGTRVRSYYLGFRTDRFEQEEKEVKETVTMASDDIPEWLVLNKRESLFDILCGERPAQYAKADGSPKGYWDKCKSKLSELDTRQLHYVQVPINHIVLDFDIKDKDGKKSFELNAKAASEFPPTYAELSKGGGLHLHYIYDGDPLTLDTTFGDDIEIKVNRGNSALRRKLTLCNDIQIATISSGLPTKGEKKKMVTSEQIKSEQGLRQLIKRNLNKEIHPGTKPSVEFIKKILDDAYEQGLQYDVSDMYDVILSFAMHSTNHSDLCCKMVDEMKFHSEEKDYVSDDRETDDDILDRLIVWDVEVYPNFFGVCYKKYGDHPVVKLRNPTPEMIEGLVKELLVGFNNRKYDNHIMYARMMGYSNEQLYKLSQQMIVEHTGYFREAYNLSYTDIYDFASAANKMSLKKWEIKLGITHKEMSIPWDEPIPDERIDEVMDYCANDVLATEAVFNHLKSDFMARKILADLAGGTVNDTTNQLTTKFIFGNNKKPQNEFCYRDLSKPVKELPEDVYEFLRKAKPDMMAQTHGEEQSLLPYFPGYLYDKFKKKSTYREFNENNPYKQVVSEGGLVVANLGVWYGVGLLDVKSMHPNSTISECLFGPRYTKAFKDIVDGRVSIKDEAWDIVNEMLDGKLKPYVQMVLDGSITSDDLANALKTAINSVYGLTDASFDNAFRDSRNIDNIVAKRGALFMVDLKNAVEEKGYTVVHIKTDSIKIANVTPEIISFVMDFGKKYGYEFDHEATYDRMCLVNDAVYIAKYLNAEACQRTYGYIPKNNKKHGGEWTATGAQFQVPYVFKTLFSGEEVGFNDMCETFSVSKGALYLDMNETMPDVTQYEKELDKARSDYKKGKLSDITYDDICNELEPKIAEGHHYTFVGRVGQFCPIKEGNNGGVLYRMQDGKYYAPSGSKGYRWLESVLVKELGMEDCIDERYYDELCSDAIEVISKYAEEKGSTIDNFINDEDEQWLPF